MHECPIILSTVPLARRAQGFSFLGHLKNGLISFLWVMTVAYLGSIGSPSLSLSSVLAYSSMKSRPE